MKQPRNFTVSTTLGALAEQFVREHYYELTGEKPLMLIPISHAGATHIEGLDLLDRDLTPTVPSSVELPEYLPLGGGVLYDMAETVKVAEIKALFDSNIIIHNHRGCWKVPTVPFELWSSSTRNNEGWLLQMESPEPYNRKRFLQELEGCNNGKILRAVQPDVFFYVGYTGPENELEQKPFMAITFPKYKEEVLPFLYEYAKGYGLDLKQFPPHDPADREYWRDLYDRHIVCDRLINVPFDLLKGMARVVMIDEPPKPANNYQAVHLQYYTDASQMTISTM